MSVHVGAALTFLQTRGSRTWMHMMEATPVPISSRLPELEFSAGVAFSFAECAMENGRLIPRRNKAAVRSSGARGLPGGNEEESSVRSAMFIVTTDPEQNQAP